MTDYIAEHGYLFLGSRLKRLAEQMQEDVSRVSDRAGLAIPPGKYPLLAILADHGPQSIGDLAHGLGLSQPATTRAIGKLVTSAFVQVDRSRADGRSRIASLTDLGARTIDRSRALVWPQVEAAVRQVVAPLSGSLLDQIDAIERAMADRSLAERAASLAAADLVPANDADVAGIVALMNRAYRGSGASSGWNTEAGYITGSRITEPLLRADIAEKPDASLLTWLDRSDGTLIGCVWLEPLGDGAWYLGSLTVDPQRQNGGFGHVLLASAEQWVRDHAGTRVRMTVVNIRGGLIAWYTRRGYVRTGETSPFPYGDDRFGTPQRDDLSFVVLEKDLASSPRPR
ncbi:bifunctional helix-turn-helix transcriptional regulator/GNAT family N-acetyltransferase [Lichenihabitans psoromatis]|uniref:bifunctional helix-turn-helix transcriptional regulator/GNAT family N-acetyltransferase n=1 Tax=Lichenihabitans psoromatis TaxID=2528642 RepID=UPI00103838A0|nr:bifunctional helix-turn-helix transcriptional regulator/GNAT family N-acetyltransferase [Lichenihabitans psoromatis]